MWDGVEPCLVSVMLFLDRATVNNGCLMVAAGSHRWGPHAPPREDDPRIERACMRAGSVLVWQGPLYHRGGANRSGATRLGITIQYCQPWLRQVENMVLAVPPEKAARYSPRIREMSEKQWRMSPARKRPVSCK